jgi:long-chain fatty acid transport protein
MKHFRLALLSTLIGTSVISKASFAGAFQLYELGTPIIGTAGVGQAAVAEDASTAYFNPAGMPLLQNSQFMLGAQMLFTSCRDSLLNRA